MDGITSIYTHYASLRLQLYLLVVFVHDRILLVLAFTLTLVYNKNIIIIILTQFSNLSCILFPEHVHLLFCSTIQKCINIYFFVPSPCRLLSIVLELYKTKGLVNLSTVTYFLAFNCIHHKL